VGKRKGMIMEKCPYHDDLAKEVSEIGKSISLTQKDIEYMRKDLELVLSRFASHVSEAEKEGGRHERLFKAEAEIQAIKEQRRNDLIVSRWFMLGAGIIGGGVVSGSIKFWGGLSKILGV
jgi:hypothetical protein